MSEAFFAHEPPRDIEEAENRLAQIRGTQGQYQPFLKRIGPQFHLRLQQRVVLRRDTDIYFLAERIRAKLVFYDEAGRINPVLGVAMEWVALRAARSIAESPVPTVRLVGR